MTRLYRLLYALLLIPIMGCVSQSSPIDQSQLMDNTWHLKIEHADALRDSRPVTVYDVEFTDTTVDMRINKNHTEMRLSRAVDEGFIDASHETVLFNTYVYSYTVSFDYSLDGNVLHLYNSDNQLFDMDDPLRIVMTDEGLAIDTLADIPVPEELVMGLHTQDLTYRLDPVSN